MHTIRRLVIALLLAKQKYLCYNWKHPIFRSKYSTR